MPAIELSILIVSWNVRDFVLACLDSIFQHTAGVEYEIILVDNASKDQTAAAVRQKFPTVKIIQNDENLGFAAANNRGLAMANGHYLVLLNPDTKLTENTFRRIIDSFAQHPEVGAIGCKLVNGEGEIDFQCAKNMPTIGNHIFEPYVAKVFPGLMKSFVMRDWDHLDSREVELLSGACLAIRREVYGRVGQLDAAMFMYVEDVEYCHRIRQAGWKLFYLSDTSIIHYGGESTKQNKHALQAENVRNLRKFFSKYRSPLYGYIFELLVILEYGVKYVLLLLLKGWRPQCRHEDIQQYRHVVVELLRHP
jgi:GT2 family glycosyltransferase